jgi:hypothetical protein
MTAEVCVREIERNLLTGMTTPIHRIALLHRTRNEARIGNCVLGVVTAFTGLRIRNKSA